MTDSLITATDGLYAALRELTGEARSLLPFEGVEALQTALRGAVDAIDGFALQLPADDSGSPLFAVATTGRGVARDLIARSSSFASRPTVRSALDLVDRVQDLMGLLLALPALRPAASAPTSAPA